MLVRAARRWLASIWEDPFRKAENEHATLIDAPGFQMAAVATLVTMLPWIPAMPQAVQAVAVPHCFRQTLICVVASQLAHRRPQLYARHREVVAVGIQLFGAWSHVRTAFIGDCGVLRFHGGCALSLAALLIFNNGAFWMLAYVLHGRLLVSVNCVALPLMAGLFVWSSGTRMCRVMLEVPGIATPLAELHASVAVANSVAAAPLGRTLAMHSLSKPASPMQQCLALNIWSYLLVAVLVPLLLMLPLERRARQRYESLCARRRYEAACAAAAAERTGEARIPAVNRPRPPGSPAVSAVAAAVVRGMDEGRLAPIPAFVASSCIAWLAVAAAVQQLNV